MTLHTCLYGSEFFFRIMALLYHSSWRYNRLQAFKHRDLHHRGVFFLGGLLMFENTDLLIQSSSFASSAWLLSLRESLIMTVLGKQEDGFFTFTLGSIGVGLSFRLTT